MKALCFVTFYICCLGNTFSQTTTLDSLLRIREAAYVGKPLDSIIAILPPGITSFKVSSGDRPERANQLIVRYPNGISISLYVREFTHIKQPNYEMNWSVREMRKEKLHHTVIYEHNNCLTNCDDEY